MTSGTTSFRDVTGGVYKVAVRERAAGSPPYKEKPKFLFLGNILLYSDLKEFA